MMAGTSNYKKIFLLLFCVIVIWLSLAIGNKSEQYWTAPTNIVAVASTFEFTSKLPSGESIPIYSTNVLEKYTQPYAVLFYVVSPQQHAGKHFRLQECEPIPLSDNFPAPIYEIGKLYYFQFSENPVDTDSNFQHWFGLCADDFFSIPSGGEGRLNVGKTSCYIYYSSTHDAMQALQQLKAEQIEIEQQQISLSNKLQNVQASYGDDKQDIQIRQIKGLLLNLNNGKLPANKNQQKVIKMQIERLKLIGK